MRAIQDLGDVFRLPDVRRTEFGWGLSVVGELAGMVALVAYAYGKGGAALAAAYVAARTLGGMGMALGMAGFTGRVRRDTLLRQFTVLRAVLLALAALAAAVSGPPVMVIVLAAASSSLAGTYRPLQVAILPWLVRTPAELTSANATAAMLENSGTLAGPLLAGLLLVLTPAWVPVAVAAGFVALAALSLRRLAVPDEAGQPPARRAGSAAREAPAGLRDLARVVPPAGLPVLAFAQPFVRGALTVLVAVLAVKTLALGTSAVGWLNAAIGAGGLVGGAITVVLVRVTRLGRSFIGGLLLWGLPLAVLAAAPSPVAAYLALVVVGIGNAILDVSAFTLLARVVEARVMSRVLYALEFVVQGGLSAGAVAAPLLLDALGLRVTLAVLGGGLVIVTMAYAMRFAQLDRTMPRPGPELDQLRHLPMFEPLPLAVIELLAAGLRPRQFAPGEVAVREGDRGDLFHLIVSGSARVTVRGSLRPPLNEGDCFGEIALLRDIPRTATVVAEEAMRTLALEREAFLLAVAGNGISSAAADALVTQRLAADPVPDARLG